jgi:hypothetical protein
MQISVSKQTEISLCMILVSNTYFHPKVKTVLVFTLYSPLHVRLFGTQCQNDAVVVCISGSMSYAISYLRLVLKKIPRINFGKFTKLSNVWQLDLET